MKGTCEQAYLESHQIYTLLEELLSIIQSVYALYGFFNINLQQLVEQQSNKFMRLSESSESTPTPLMID